MSRHCYPAASLAKDYLRAGIGIAATFALVLFADLSSVMLWTLGSLGALFLVFAAHTALRQATCFELTGTGIRALGPFPTDILWEELRGLNVRYYSTKKDRTGGWMQLTLAGSGGRQLRIDSSIDGFRELARRAAEAAIASGVLVSDSSRANLAALGIALGDAVPEGGRPGISRWHGATSRSQDRGDRSGDQRLQ